MAALLLSKNMIQTPYLLLTAPGKDYTGPVVVASCSDFVLKTVEQAGAALHKRQVAISGGAGAAAAATRTAARTAAAKAAKAAADEDDNREPTEAERKKMLKHMEKGNHYELLGLGALNVNATDEQIRKAHRKFVLKYHPDKKNQTAAANAAIAATNAAAAAVGAGDGGEGKKKKDNNNNKKANKAASLDEDEEDATSDPLFLAIQKAYDILSDESRRRAYDSEFEFDDKIPSGTEVLATDEAFFTLYGPVFERNSRFSVSKPVPKLGNMETEDAKVALFYKFWFGFDSWRDFSGLGEHDSSTAEYREEKRWMERQNKNVVAKAKKAEMTRIQELVTRAHSKDPRILRLRAAEEEEKKRVRDAKQAAIQAAEDAKKKEAAEAAAKLAVAEASKKQGAAAQKAVKEAEKRTQKRCRVNLRRAVEALVASDPASCPITETDVEWYVARVPIPTLVAVYGEVFGDALMQTLLDQQQILASGGTLPAEGAGAASPVAGVSALINLFDAVHAEKEREQDAIHGRDRRAAAGPTSSGASIVIGKKEEVDWSPQELSMLAKAMAKHPGGARNRWMNVANYVNTLGQDHPRSQDECIAKAQKIGEEEKKKMNQNAFAVSMAQRRAEIEIKDCDTPSASNVVVANVTIVGAGGSGSVSVLPPVVSAVVQPTTTTTTAEETAAAPHHAGEESSEAGIWTPAQQVALEEALKKYPSSLEKNERWRLIGEAVPGKHKKQCVARFKEVREKVLTATASTK